MSRFLRLAAASVSALTLLLMTNCSLGQEKQVFCMNKVMMTEELEWDHKIKCHHSFGKRCYETFITTYNTEEEEKCRTEYRKQCRIDFRKSAREVEVEVCLNPLERNCDAEGPQICTHEHESVCEYLVKRRNITDDVPKCEIIQESVCDDNDDTDCEDVNRQVCEIDMEERGKTKASSQCKRIRTEICGPQPCPLIVGEQICEIKRHAVLDDSPEEECELHPVQICGRVTRLVPRLEPRKKCVQVPREICVRVRVNPRRVKKPVLRQWCGDRPFQQEEEEEVEQGARTRRRSGRVNSKSFKGLFRT